MSASVLTPRIAEAAKILNSKSPAKAEKLIVDTLKKCDCDPADDASENLIHYIGLDNFLQEMGEVLGDVEGVPEKPRHRMMWDILLGQDLYGTSAPKPEQSEIAQILKDQRPVGQWKDQELLDAYNQDCDPEVEATLKKKASGAPIVVFVNEDEGVVDVEASLKCLRMSRRRDRMPDMMRFDGKLKRLYRVGEFPSLVVYQCPFHPDVILFDGYCDRDDADWSAVSYEAKQFARLVYEADEQPRRHRGVLSFIAVAEDGVEALKAEYPKIGLEFDELRREDDLPSLKQRHSGAKGTQDPINPGNKVRY